MWSVQLVHSQQCAPAANGGGVLEVQGEVVTHECSPQGNNRSSSPHNNLANHHMVESKLV